MLPLKILRYYAVSIFSHRHQYIHSLYTVLYIIWDKTGINRRYILGCWVGKSPITTAVWIKKKRKLSISPGANKTDGKQG